MPPRPRPVPPPATTFLHEKPTAGSADPDDDHGLTDDEVAARISAGEVNTIEDRTSRSLSEIARANVFTRFNAILAALNLAVLATGRLADATFGLIFFSNTIIGIVQEVRAKRTLDRLAILHAPTCTVRRSGAAVELPVAQIVLGDLLELHPGDQVPADATLVRSDELEVDESLLTGESGAVAKHTGEAILSGSIVVAGRCLARTTSVGEQSYARRVTADARRFILTTSEVRASINRILRVITWILVVVAPLIIWSQWRTNADWRTATAGAVAALSGLVPEGLVLLTSVTMVVSAANLARRHVLVQELAAVEGLARVDVVCLDKTGTLTDGTVRLETIEPVDPGDDEVTAALAALAGAPDANATMRAVAAALGDPDWKTVAAVPFSSARKWSGATFVDHGTWVVGAPEVVGDTGPLAHRAETIAASGRRVLLIARSSSPLIGSQLPDDVDPAALCILSERVRSDATEILRYFTEQGIRVKLISGDHPRAVAAIAERAGLTERVAFDARELPDDDQALDALVDHHHVYGRVTPDQKRQLVRSLQRRGHTVAMTGDGVNDALALKEADIGVAMGSGAPATRAVAQLVLLDDRFAQLPSVVGEGRRVIHNVERVANLYLTKNVYSLTLILAVVMAGVSYPFLPRQLTLITAVTYGIPSIFLALAPHQGRHEAGFLRRLLRFSIPSGLVMAIAILGAQVLTTAAGGPVSSARSASVIAAVTAGLGLLILVARPLRYWKVVLIGTMAALAVAALSMPVTLRFLEMDVQPVSVSAGLLAGVAGAAGAALIDARLRPR